MDVRPRWLTGSLAFLAMACVAGVASAAMSADDLVLIVNKQQPAGRTLAEEYAKLRHVPDGRIIEIDLPDRDDVDRAYYDASIAAVVRREIESRGLKAKATCAVLFYGVPLRIRERTASPRDRAEVTEILEPMHQALLARVNDAAAKLEAIAREATPTFAPAAVPDGPAGLQQRLQVAERAALNGIAQAGDAAQQRALGERLKAAQSLLTTLPAFAGITFAKPTALPTPAEVAALAAARDDPDARRDLRNLVHATNNSFQLYAIVDMQRAQLTATETESSVDSELSCVWLPAYPLGRWIPNPFFHAGGAAALRPMMIRTCRIDGPTPDVARRTFNDSVVAEQRGLAGDVILDARGLSGNGGFGSYEYYDATIRRCFGLFKNDPELSTRTDDGPELIGDHVSDRAAIYCGWYRVRNFAPVASFVPGSIAVHVASYEMIGLRAPSERGWCRGLLLAGADATMGAVGEPYLLAFPPADDFFSLLLTGKATLAEAYWATLPVTSWKIILIGDPLYRPFAAKPAMEIDALSPSLRAAADGF